MVEDVCFCGGSYLFFVSPRVNVFLRCFFFFYIAKKISYDSIKISFFVVIRSEIIVEENHMK